MRRGQLEDLLREVGRVTGRHDAVMIGSQCVHAATTHVPAEVTMSVECDLLLDDSDPAAERIDAELGSASKFRDQHLVFVDTVSSTFPFLPEGWETRLRPLDAKGFVARCLEIHDLVLSKLAAGRLKDYELIAALLAHELADATTARERILAVADLHMRAILLARLQIVIESQGR